jgi:SAM-dependent methyltransferase
VGLYRRGLTVECIDTSEAMVLLARATVAEAGAGDRVRVRVGDAHALTFPDASRDLVIALGVLPFLHSPAAALADMARILKPGAYLVISSDNPLRLNYVLDPRLTPLGAPIKRLIKSIVGWRKRSRHSIRELARSHHPLDRRSFEHLLTDASFDVVRCVTLGFGPFTFFNRPLLSTRATMNLHRRLQAWADRGAPLLRDAGVQHLALAVRRSETVMRALEREPGRPARAPLPPGAHATAPGSLPGP